MYVYTIHSPVMGKSFFLCFFSTALQNLSSYKDMLLYVSRRTLLDEKMHILYFLWLKQSVFSSISIITSVKHTFCSVLLRIHAQNQVFCGNIWTRLCRVMGTEQGWKQTESLVSCSWKQRQLSDCFQTNAKINWHTQWPEDGITIVSPWQNK